MSEVVDSLNSISEISMISNDLVMKSSVNLDAQVWILDLSNEEVQNIPYQGIFLYKDYSELKAIKKQHRRNCLPSPLCLKAYSSLCEGVLLPLSHTRRKITTLKTGDEST